MSKDGKYNIYVCEPDEPRWKWYANWQNDDNCIWFRRLQEREELPNASVIHLKNWEYHIKKHREINNKVVRFLWNWKDKTKIIFDTYLDWNRNASYHIWIRNSLVEF